MWLVILIFIFIVLLAFLWNSQDHFRYNTNKGKIISDWVDHLLYTRLAMMAIFDNNPRLSEFVSRLMKNQTDISRDVGIPKLESLLKTHIQYAAEYMTNVKQYGQVDPSVLHNLYNNAQEIGQLLDSTLHTSVYKQHMKHHIDTLIANIQAYHKSPKPVDQDIETLDRYINAGMSMAIEMAKDLSR